MDGTCMRDELKMRAKAAEIVRSQYKDEDVNFRVVTLKEPPKQEMLAFLDNERRDSPTPQVPIRCARVEITLKVEKGGNELHEYHVDLDGSSILRHEVLKGKHSYVDSTYMKEVEAACLADQGVQDEIKKLDLPPGASVVVEPWTYATDGQNDMSKRISMVRTASCDLTQPILTSTVLVLPPSSRTRRCQLLRLPTRSLRRDIRRPQNQQGVSPPFLARRKDPQRAAEIRSEKNAFYLGQQISS